MGRGVFPADFHSFSVGMVSFIFCSDFDVDYSHKKDYNKTENNFHSVAEE